MRIILSILTTLLLSNLIVAQTTAIPDANFEQALINLGYDSGSPDGSIPTSNINSITSLNISNSQISDLTGIQDFSALVNLECYINQLTSLDITQNTALTSLVCALNQLTSLDITQNLSLAELECSSNQLTSLNVSQNTAITKLNCYDNPLTNLDVSQNIALTELKCYNNQLTSLNVTQNVNLTYLSCYYNQITSLNTTQNPALTYLSCGYNPITSLNLTQNLALTYLDCIYNQLISLNVSQNAALTNIQAYSNNLTCLNVKNGNNSNFTDFRTHSNPNLTCIEVDDSTYSATNWTFIDFNSTFSTNCSSPCSVGIEENSLANFSLYPNPTTENITIDLGKLRQDIKVTLTNSLGQVILTQKYSATSFINIDIEAPKGIYFLQIETSKRVTKTIKVLKE